MQNAYDLLIDPALKGGTITEEDAKTWTERTYTTASARKRLFYEGTVEGTGWPIEKVVFLDQIMEYGVYLDVHDGTSMGGSVIYIDLPSVFNVISDMVAESASLEAIVRRLNGAATSASMILNLADESDAASMECSSLAGNQVRLPEDDSLAVVNTFLNPDWGVHKRETVSNSLRGYENMTARLSENKGKIDAEKTQEMMDLRLFNEDGTFAENGSCTNPTVQDADLTNHQVVTDLSRRQIWLKIPVPNYFADWTHFDLE